MNVNLKGMMRVMRAAIPGMQEMAPVPSCVCHLLSAQFWVGPSIFLTWRVKEA